MTAEPAPPTHSTEAAPPPTDGLPQPQRRWAMATILLGIAVAVLDGTIVSDGLEPMKMVSFVK